MKAILLAGGKGTRLRPLTLHTPKPIVPILERPFLHYQLDLLKQVPEIDEVILSLNYQPRRIEEIFGDGSDAGESLHDSVVVFNGDVLTNIDLAAVIARHRERRARATIVLTPVENPSAYGLVETDADGNIQRFLEKPNPDEITCDTINAGIYVLEPDTFDRIPKDTPWSIERSFFPSLIERHETFIAVTHRGYWIDIGTPEKYMQVHRDIMDGRYRTAPFDDDTRRVYVSPKARVDEGVQFEGPCFVDDGAVIKAGATIGRYAVVGRQCHIEEHAVVEQSIIWSGTRVGTEATVRRAILGRQCHVGRNALVEDGVVLGDKSTLTDFTRL
jgi:NDP-sugar pyrophosphorylase family protein